MYYFFIFKIKYLICFRLKLEQMNRMFKVHFCFLLLGFYLKNKPLFPRFAVFAGKTLRSACPTIYAGQLNSLGPCKNEMGRLTDSQIYIKFMEFVNCFGGAVGHFWAQRPFDF